jgi:hypothetical protein
MSSALIKNSFSSLGELDVSISPTSLVLKLAVNQESLRYFVVSQTHQQVIFFGDYTLHHVNASAAMTGAIEKIFEKDEILQLDFAKILIGFDEKYSLMQQEFSNTLVRPKESILVSRCSDIDIGFESHEEVVSLLKKLFKTPELLHINSTYFKVLPHYLDDSGQKLFLSISRKHFDAIFFGDKSHLQLMNRYVYRTATDFIYFVLLCCDELKIDRETTELILIGELDIQSKIYELCFRYFRYIRFIQKPGGIHFSKAFEVYPKHLHFNLYNLHSCE